MAQRPFSPVTFEIDLDASAVPAPNKVIINLNAGDSDIVVAAAIASAVNQAVLDGKLTALIAVANGPLVSLGGGAEQQVDLSAAPGISRLPVGNVDVIIPDSVAALADGQTMTIVDGSGNSVTFELNNTDPAGTLTAVTGGNVAVDVDLSVATAFDVATALAAAVNAEIAARHLQLGMVSVGAPTAAGVAVTIIGDDEDGVSFGAPFNSASNPVPISVVATGAGMLDAWIDWNGDGDFADANERLFTTSTPVHAGVNLFDIQTPVGAVVGFTTARFRLSTIGGLLTNGIGIGGEVEDYQIEIIGGQPPVAVSDSYAVDEDNTLTVSPTAGVLSNDTDGDIVTPATVQPGVNIWVQDEDPSTLAINPLQDVNHGTLTLQADGSFVYVPEANFHGTDSFTYIAGDGTVDSLVATVTLLVASTNDPPVAAPESYMSSVNQTLTINAANGVLANDTDVDGDTLTAILSSSVTHGNLSLNANGSFSYTPDNNFHGMDSFTYTASDGTTVSDPVTVTIMVNTAPVAVADSYTISEDTILDVLAATGVLANDTDDDGDTLTAVVATPPTNGQLTLNADGSFQYAPNANFAGTDSFTYVANDGSVDSNSVTVTITVNSQPDAPVASEDSYIVPVDGTLSVDAAA
ncbi:MAG: tandem-95 repeat protein, partial [Planctomycetales bacterium]|nr:tandem-95 repeat protein [Planctomycetales bacterium]